MKNNNNLLNDAFFFKLKKYRYVLFYSVKS